MKDHLGVYYDLTSDFQQEQFDVLRAMIDANVNDKNAVSSLLDIGCGTGTRTEKMLSVFPNVSRALGVEPDWDMLSVAQEQHASARLSFRKMPAEDLLSLSGDGTSFDAVVSNWALHWVQDKEKMFAGINALTKSGAWMMFSTCERLPAILMMIDTYIRNEFRISSGHSPYHYLTLAGWKDMLRAHGWEAVSTSAYPIARELDDAKEYLDHWFTASTAKFLYGRHLAELSPLTHSDLVWMMNRAFPSMRYKGGLAFQEDVMFVIARKN